MSNGSAIPGDYVPKPSHLTGSSTSSSSGPNTTYETTHPASGYQDLSSSGDREPHRVGGGEGGAATSHSHPSSTGDVAHGQQGNFNAAGTGHGPTDSRYEQGVSYGAGYKGIGSTPGGGQGQQSSKGEPFGTATVTGHEHRTLHSGSNEHSLGSASHPSGSHTHSSSASSAFPSSAITPGGFVASLADGHSPSTATQFSSSNSGSVSGSGPHIHTTPGSHLSSTSDGRAFENVSTAGAGVGAGLGGAGLAGSHGQHGSSHGLEHGGAHSHSHGDHSSTDHGSRGFQQAAIGGGALGAGAGAAALAGHSSSHGKNEGAHGSSSSPSKGPTIGGVDLKSTGKLDPTNPDPSKVADKISTDGPHGLVWDEASNKYVHRRELSK